MSIEHYPKPEVGMEVFVVPSNRRQKSYIDTITKVGWKFVELKCYKRRFLIDTWRIADGQYSSQGTCYPSEQHYNDKAALFSTWITFKNMITYANRPEKATVERIQQAAALLGIEI